MTDQDNTDVIRAAVVHASETGEPVNISAGNSKSFYANACEATVLDVSAHSGIVDYEPSELYITARCGTRLQEIEDLLHQHQQMLPFEPPHFSQSSTIGGTVACGLSGPRRPYSGAVRDCVLGAHITNGAGDYLRFGGQVMKNVAGYDVARLMCGAVGTLGVIMQVSLKVTPMPHAEITLQFEYSERAALDTMNRWALDNLPISATYFEQNNLFIRIAGIESTLSSIKHTLGGEQLADGELFWKSVKEQQRDFFYHPAPLWRLSIPADTPTPDIFDHYSMEWNGGLRWIKTHLPEQEVFATASAAAGHATLFKSNNKTVNCFQPLSSHLQELHTDLKRAFDPKHILNPGKMYS